jgi:hypothetical protein
VRKKWQEHGTTISADPAAHTPPPFQAALPPSQGALPPSQAALPPPAIEAELLERGRRSHHAIPLIKIRRNGRKWKKVREGERGQEKVRRKRN